MSNPPPHLLPNHTFKVIKERDASFPTPGQNKLTDNDQFIQEGENDIAGSIPLTSNDQLEFEPGEPYNPNTESLVRSEPARLENFTNQFKDKEGNVVATETAIRNQTVERKTKGLESKLEALQKDLEVLGQINEEVLQEVGDKKLVATAVEISKILTLNDKDELEDLKKKKVAIENQVQAGKTNILHSPKEQNSFKEIVNRIKVLEQKTQDDLIAEVSEKIDSESSKIIPTLIKLSDELKSQKKKELDRLLSDPYTLSQNSSRKDQLKSEIQELENYTFSPSQLISQKMESLKSSINKTENELRIFKEEVAETGATHASTNTPRYRFQFIPHRELATKTTAELENIAKTSSKKNLRKLLKNIEQIEGISIPTSKGKTDLDYRKEIGQLLVEARDKIIPQYIEEFKAAKEHGTPVLINSQLQTVEGNDGNLVSSLGRSGAISDFAHGEISLQEQKNYQNLQLMLAGTLKNPQAINRLTMLYDLKKGEGIDKEKLSDLVLSIKAKIILSYGGENIIRGNPPPEKFSTQNLWTGDSPLRLASQKLAIKNNLSKLSPDEVSLLKSSLKDVDLNVDKLNEINNKREQDLAGLALQDLEMHFEKTPVIKDKAIYCRMGLLDLAKDGKNEYNSLFNERTQGLDTFATLNFLDGKKIIFDVEEGKGSFIHADGTIHMPARCQSGGVKETTLSTAFLNVSVQGNVKNAGLQKSLNTFGLARLERLGVPKEELQNIKGMLNKISGAGVPLKGDVNKAARQIIDTVREKLDGYVSANCYGGKDRTGALLALMTKSALKNNFSKVYDENADEWRTQITSNDGVMAKIADANAGHSVVKTMARNVALFGTIERLRHYSGAMKLGKQAAKGIASESKAPGQLFKQETKKEYTLPKGMRFFERSYDYLSTSTAEFFSKFRH